MAGHYNCPFYCCGCLCGDVVGCPRCCRITNTRVTGRGRQLAPAQASSLLHATPRPSSNLLWQGFDGLRASLCPSLRACSGVQLTVKAIPTPPSHQPSPGPPMSGQRGCSSRHHSYLNFKQHQSPFKAIVSQALWVPGTGGRGYGASWEFTLCTGNPCVIFKAAGTGGMARGDSRSIYPFLSGLENSPWSPRLRVGL